MSITRTLKVGVAAIVLAAVVALAISATKPTAGPDAGSRSTTAEVVAVVDGDTIDVELPDGKERVRIIGVDTPEIAREASETDDCYAQDARTFLDELLYGRTVELRTDPSQQDIDKYGRLLRHVYVDGQDAALAALSAGVGVEYTYAAPYAGQADYRAAEAAARDEQLGLWGACPNPSR